MNAMQTLSSLPFVQPTAWALVHSVWQGALLALALSLALAPLRGKSPRLRYAVALAAFLALPALVLATAWRAGGAERGPWRSTKADAAGPGFVALERAAATADSGAGPSRRSFSGPASHGSLRASGMLPLPGGDWERTRAALRPTLPWLFVIWLCGVAALSAAQLAGWLEIYRRRRSGGRPLGAELQAALPRLCRRLGIRRPVALLESAAVAVPAVVGWLRPLVLMPASALAGLTPQQLELILAHELAHVRRHDYLINLVQAAVETVFFYHPAAWWMSRQVRREREHCCDDLAVAVGGDRLEYARALTVLEGLRAAPLRLAPAATGPGRGALLARIRRLVSPATGAGSPRAAYSWLAGALGLALLALGAAVPLFGISAIPGLRGQAADAQGGAAAEVWRGQWTAERERQGDDVRLQMTHRSRDGREHWSSSFTLPATELAGFGGGPDAHFELRRDAGTFAFTGRFEGSGPDAQGAGFFTFRPNPDYARQMAALGYRISQDRLVELALHDVSLAFVREMQELGYRGIPLDRLVEFRIHGVTPDFVRELAALGYRGLPAERLVEFRIHGVTPEFVRGLAAQGYPDIPAGRLVEFRIHGVSPELVHDLAALGYRDLPAERLVEFRIHGVSADLVREVAAQGYPNLPADRLVEWRIHGVTPAYLREMSAAGYRGLDPERLVEFRIHGVSPEYLRDLAAAGYAHVEPETLVSMRIHGVDAAFIRDMASRGYHNLSPEELVTLRIHGGDRHGRR